MAEDRHFNRFQAGLTHLGASALVALAALVLVFIFWYPDVMAQAQGVSRLLMILIGVDVVLGPAITTIIWNPGKGNWLRFDLFVIALVQTLALLYGLQAIYGGRPAYLVFNIDRFEITAFQEVDAASHSRAPAEFRRSFWGYRTASARLPEDQKERQELLFNSVSGGPDLRQLPHLFLPLHAERETMLAKLHPMGELRTINELDEAAWIELIASFRRPESELGYLPMRGNLEDGAVVLDAKTGEMLGIRMLTPSFASPKKSAPTSPTVPAEQPGPFHQEAG